MAAESPPSLLQLAFQVNEVVNLSIENHDVTAIDRVHWLVALLAQILNSQPPVAQGNTGCGICPRSFIVRAAMAQSRGHTQRSLFQLKSREAA